MRRILAPLAACLLLLAASSTSASAAWTHDATSLGTRITTRSAYYPTSCADGSGGTFIAYLDLATQRVWVQHLDASGNLLWGNDGVQAGGNVAYWPESIVPDGVGGCIVSWFYWYSNNEDIYVQRLNASGTPVWTSGGLLVCGAANNQQYSVLAPDGNGGAYVAWLDYRNNASVTDIYAQYVSSSGVAQWTANGIAVCTAADDQSKLSVAPDGSGGVILCWQDSRSGVYKAVYAQHYNSSGSGSWGTNGLALTTGVNADQWTPTIVSDGRTGAIIAWNDWRNGNSDVFAQRITSAGTLLWAANGVALESASGDQTTPVLASDGASGAVVAWVDGRSGTSNDVYAQRVNALGVPLWATNGVALCTAGGNQVALQGVGDGSGGAIFAWSDRRNGVDDDLYAQHVSSAGLANWTADGVAVNTMTGNQAYMTLSTDGSGGASVAYFSPSIYGCVSRLDRYGMLGGAAPTIVSVRDVPGDQGGYVTVRWNRSWPDVVPGDPISQYWIWRQVPQIAAQALLRQGATLLAAGQAPRPGTLRAGGNGTDTWYWEYLSYVTAQGQAGYSAVVPTRGDSVTGSNPRTLFMIEARWSAVSGEYWDSAPDSGYSVDNLAPATPAPFTGTYAGGTASLGWAASTEGDFREYRLYRGANAGFTPSGANLLATPSGTSYADAAGAPYCYKLSAVDLHGNESAFVTLLPAGTTDVEDRAPRALAFAPPLPNPAGGRCELAFALPARGPASIQLFDASGRRVRTVTDGEFAPGGHRVALELRDAAGRALAPGLYLVRLEAHGRAITRRLAVVR